MLQNYIVTLRSCYRTQIYRTVTGCVSATAACRVAELLQRMEGGSTLRYDATYANQVA